MGLDTLVSFCLFLLTFEVFVSKGKAQIFHFGTPFCLQMSVHVGCKRMFVAVLFLSNERVGKPRMSIRRGPIA